MLANIQIPKKKKGNKSFKKTKSMLKLTDFLDYTIFILNCIINIF